MAFPTGTWTHEAAFERAQKTAAGLRVQCISWSATMAARDVSYEEIGRVLATLLSSNDVMDEVKSVPGIVGYVNAQTAFAGYDMATEFANMQAAIVAAALWIRDALPRDSGNANKLAVYTINASAEISPVYFAPAQTSALRALLDNIVAEIEPA